MPRYDLIVIGAGPGGYVAAIYAARHGKRVCIVEKSLVGGTCLNRGCIPTKVMLNTSSTYSRMGELANQGIFVNELKLDYAALAAYRDVTVCRLRGGIESLLKNLNIDVVSGVGRFLSADQLSVGGGDPLSGKDFIIATGSVPASLTGISIDEDVICTSDGILALKALPRRLLIVGGGVIGVEFASIFRSLGSDVLIAEVAERILPGHSREISRRLEGMLKMRGIQVLTSTSIVSIGRENEARAVSATGREIIADKVLVSVGRKPDVESLGCDKLGIALKDGKIDVDVHLRTKHPNIYAIGDCTMGPQLAHRASYDAFIAVDNMLGFDRCVDYASIPSCVYTDPEIASVGLIEEAARSSSPDCKVVKVPYSASGKAQLLGRPEGYIKIIGSKDGKILGAEIFGQNACDLISEISCARQSGMTIKDLSMIVHAHPTISEVIQEAALLFLGTPIHSA